MPVTRSTAVVLRPWYPALVAPVGLPMLAERVMPVGMTVGIEAVIFAELWLVVTAQVLPVEVTEVGAPPATAAEIARDGVPATEIRLIASTCIVTVWFAVWAEAEAAAAAPSRT